MEKILNLHNFIILTKSVLNKYENHNYYKIFLEKFSYQLAKKLSKKFVQSIIMLTFGEAKVTKEKFYAVKNYKNLRC